MVSPCELLKTAAFAVPVPGTVGLIPKYLARVDRESPMFGARIAGAADRISLGALLYLHTTRRFSDEGSRTATTE